MCFPFFSYRKSRSRNFHKLFECSCDICGNNYENMEKLITHMGRHSTDQINYRISRGYGTVRCNKCYVTFNTVADMEEHTCARSTSAIYGLSPIPSTDSLESVLIHGE